MPIYIFNCNKHGDLEILQPMNRDHIFYCPECHTKMNRIFTPVGIRCGGFSKIGKTRTELFQNLGKEGWADRDMWKKDKEEKRRKAYQERINKYK